MMADYGRMVEAMLSGLVRRAEDGECPACQACLAARERGGPTGRAGLAGFTEQVQGQSGHPAEL